jgi:hypothetical protein
MIADICLRSNSGDCRAFFDRCSRAARASRQMRKTIVLLIMLMSRPVIAQIRSGTIVVFDFTKDELVVAADSRSITKPGVPPGESCKIAAFHHEFIFTNVGSISYVRIDPTDPIADWNNTDIAKESLHNASEGMNLTDTYMDAVVNYWANIVEGHWNDLCRANRRQCTNDNVGLGPLSTISQRTELTTGIFVGAKGLPLRGAAIYFDSDLAKIFNPVGHTIGVALSHCWPCGQGEQLCAAGSHVDVAAQFCSDRKPDTKLSLRTTLRRADEHAKLAVEIVEKTIDAYEQTAGDVGGPVDAVTITKGGKIIWNSLKNNCPDNQD